MTRATDNFSGDRAERPEAVHAGPRTAMRYDRARASLGQDSTCIIAAYLVGAAR